MIYHDQIETMVSINTGSGELELEATFDIEIEEYPAEPTSWGASRGTETTIEAKFRELKLGAGTMGENMAIGFFGRDTIIEAEYTAAAVYGEQRE